MLENHLSLGGDNGEEEICVNSRYFTKNGKPWIPIMGEFHYSRVDKEQWKRELLKMKAGGITVVSCYSIWIYHEEKEGVFDFTGNRNLHEFLELVGECGLRAFLRIGPWVHGEVRNGGFPDWLLKKDCSLRQNDSSYLSYVRRYFKEIKKQTKGCLFYERGSVWGIQLENELTNQAEHLLTLRKMAEEIGLTVPVYTVTGWNATYGAEIPEFDVVPVFGGYPEAPWEKHKDKLEPNSNYFFLPSRNDSSIGKDLLEAADDTADVFHMRYELYPYATCELGGGMQVTHHRRPVMGHDDVAALALVKLGCGNNMPGYYMYHGGINDISETTLQESTATGYPNDYPIRSYDFQAPIGEYGQIRASYRQLKQQHYFIETFMETLAPMDAYFQNHPITNRQDRESLRYSVRTDGNSGFVFVNNFQRLDVLAEHKDVQFEVPDGDSTLVFPDNGMRIPSEAYFVFPYNLDLGGILLRYATLQPLYSKENTWFFFASFGITPEYCFAFCDTEKQIKRPNLGRKYKISIENSNGELINLVSLTQEEAEHFFVLEDEIYLTNGAELYKQDETVYSYGKDITDLSYYKWNGSLFEETVIHAARKEVDLVIHEFVPDLAQYTYSEGLFLDGRKNIMGYSLNITENMLAGVDDVYLEIDYIGDVLQIYVDGVLAADDFYKGIPYEVSVSYLLKYGRKVEILISEMKEGCCYMEAGTPCGLSFAGITCRAMWEEI